MTCDSSEALHLIRCHILDLRHLLHAHNSCASLTSVQQSFVSDLDFVVGDLNHLNHLHPDREVPPFEPGDALKGRKMNGMDDV